MCSQGWNPIPQNSTTISNNPALLQSMGFDSSLHPSAHSHAHLHPHGGTPAAHHPAAAAAAAAHPHVAAAAHHHAHFQHFQQHLGHAQGPAAALAGGNGAAAGHHGHPGVPAEGPAGPAGNNGSLSPPAPSTSGATTLNSSNSTTTASSSSSGSATSVTKSTKGASKMRRDMINGEIANLRDLLPLPSSTRQRLSQLQLMALVCVYVRKSNYFDQVFKLMGKSPPGHDLPSFGFSKAMNGFLLITTQTGKLLYISDNAAEYLGHSMEDLLIHGDSVYDIIDKQDHSAIQSELMRGASSAATSNGSDSGIINGDKRIFLCRMNVSRNSRRQMRFGDQKVVLIEGRFSGMLPLCSRNEPVFLSWCTPVAMPETRESIVQGATNIFTSTHEMDFKFANIDENGEYYLGYRKYDLKGVSWYSVLHPDSVKEVQSKHRLITQSENERSCILLLRLQRQDGSWLWSHSVIQVKEGGDQSPMIVCTNQILSEEEASVMRANSWLYHYYMVQSRLQYNLAYGGQPASIAAALYPQMMHMYSPNAAAAAAAAAYDASSPTSFASAGLMGSSSPYSTTTAAGSTELYSAYSPPLGSYQQLESSASALKGRHYELDVDPRDHQQQRYFRSSLSPSPSGRSESSLSPVPLTSSANNSNSAATYETSNGTTVLCLSSSSPYNANGACHKRTLTNLDSSEMEMDTNANGNGFLHPLDNVEAAVARTKVQSCHGSEDEGLEEDQDADEQNNNGNRARKIYKR